MLEYMIKYGNVSATCMYANTYCDRDFKIEGRIWTTIVGGNDVKTDSVRYWLLGNQAVRYSLNLLNYYKRD